MANQSDENTKQIHRINRIAGQLEGVKKMIQEDAYCPSILNQTRAINSAVRSLEASILENHLQSCVKNAFNSDKKTDQNKKIKELIEIFKKRLP